MRSLVDGFNGLLNTASNVDCGSTYLRSDIDQANDFDILEFSYWGQLRGRVSHGVYRASEPGHLVGRRRNQGISCNIKMTIDVFFIHFMY